jgi:uncharacterized protein (UPF0335 family)
MDIFQLLPGMSGLPGFLLTIFALVVGGWYILRLNKSQYAKAVESAQKSALEAMQTESESLRRRVEDVEKENVKLNNLIENIYTALKSKRISVMVVGDSVELYMEEDSAKKT